jgi:nicotinate dehydrogenase subunit A
MSPPRAGVSGQTRTNEFRLVAGGILFWASLATVDNIVWTLQPKDRGMPRFNLTIDGIKRPVTAREDEPLLYALTDGLKLKGPKFGCGVAQCGACTVLLDGQAIRSCVTPTASVGSHAIRTLDGLAKNGKPHPLQVAFVDEQAAQCGYCANGWIMHATALLEKNPLADEAQIRDALANIQCRCGTHMAILRAVKKAGQMMVAEANNQVVAA